MKKKLTLMCLALLTLIGGVVFAQSLRRAASGVYTVSYNGGKETSTPEGFFTHDTGGKFNFNTKFNGTYDGVSYTHGLKMEGTTKVLFTSEEEGTLTIVQSTWSNHTIKLDDNALEIASATDGGAGDSGVRVYTIENLAAGSHTISRGSGESGLFFIKLDCGGGDDSGGETVTPLFSAATTVKSDVSIDGGGATTEITSDWATITGGKLFAINEQSDAKKLITKSGFYISNNNTYFKVELEDVLTEGDVISAKGTSRTDTELGLFISTATSRPNECNTKLHIDQAEKAGAADYSSYTVVAGDGLEGAKEFYIYRETGKGTYFNNFTITRPVDDGIAKYLKTVDFSSLTSKDAEEISEEDKTAIEEVVILDKKSGTTVTINGSGDVEAPNKYNVSGEGVNTAVTLEMNGGTMTFDALESRSLRKVTFYYDEWSGKNVANTEVVVDAAARRAEGNEGDELLFETNMSVDEKEKTATWSGTTRRLVVSFAGKSVIKKMVIEFGERVGEKAVLDLPSGKDIAKEVNDLYAQNPYVGSITVNLEKGGMYTVSKTMYISKPFVINGAEGAVVDASSNVGPMIQLSEVPELGLNAAGAYEISEVTLKDLTIVGVKNRLFYADRQRYLIKKISVDNSAIHIDGTSPRAIFDFYCGGNVEDLSIVNSTLWADPSNAQLGGLFNSQSGQNVEELGGTSQKFSILNSTLYNISYGMTQMLHRDFSQPLLTFEVKDNVIANSGEKGRFLLGLNGGAQSEKSTWIVSGNAFSFDGEDTGAEEVASSGISEAALLGDVTFSDAATGDFSLGIFDNAFEQQKGDPRWLQGDANSLIVEIADGKDVAEEYAAAKGEKNPQNVLIRLAKGGKHTMNGGIEIGGNLSIKGNGATVDASALTTPLIQMATIAEDAPLNEKEAYVIDGITIKDVTITGLPYQLIYGNKQKYLMNKVLVENSVIGINGTAKKTIFDFNGGGNTAELTIDKSTLWANPSNAQNGGLFSSQSGHGSIQDLGSDKQLFAITNSTIYNIACGKTTNSQRRNNTAGMEYKVENSVIVNCGKKGQFVVGLNGGSANSAQTYTINNNIFNFDGADVSADEEAKVQEKVASVTFNSVAGVIAFTSTETPDFGGVFTLDEGASAPTVQIGDPRWSVEYVVPTAIEVVKDVQSQKTADGAWYTIQGVRVEQPTKGLYIHNGKTVIVK